MKPEPFRLQAPEAALDDLHRRLDMARWPSAEDAGWALGTDGPWLRALVAYWRDGFDWRAQEAWLNRIMPGRRAQVRGIDLHFAHLPGKGAKPTPLLLLHGWPSSFMEMHKIAGPLAEAGFEVIVPSLPGHGLSSPPADPLYGADDIADCLRDLMVEVLGHKRFAVHGGDRGSFVATGLGHRHPAHVLAIHQSLPLGILGDPPSAEEQAWLADVAAWSAEEGAYGAIQGTRPRTLGFGLGDSPIGLAAWICEKFRAWSDCDGDPLNVFTRDELLTNVMLYWLGDAIYPSMRMYWAHRNAPPAATRPVRIEVPTGIFVCPHEVYRPPRTAVARKYDLRSWTAPARGGHFPALEVPELLVEDLLSFLGPFRSA